MAIRKSTTDFGDEDTVLIDHNHVALQEAKNGLLQFDEVLRLADLHAHAKHFNLTHAVLLNLNRIAIQGIRRSAGQFREVPVKISNTPHTPPPFEEVPGLTDEMCSYVNASWFKTGDDLTDAVHLSAYLMWRLNWIHPFRDGNGRTSRAISYLALCTRLGYFIPGSPTIADLIVDNKQPYYAALDAADAAWRNSLVDVTQMESLITDLLMKQLGSLAE